MILENKNRIIESAISVFKSKGIVSSTMSDVANEVNYDRRTLYRYFQNKDDLVLEVIVSILRDWNKYQEGIYDSLSGNGLSRFSKFYRALIKEDRIDLVVLVTEFDMIFDLFSFEERTGKTELIEAYNFEAKYPQGLLENIIQFGMDDASIKQVDISKTVPVIHNVLWSTIQKASISNRSINDVLNINFENIIKEQIQMYVEYLRG